MARVEHDLTPDQWAAIQAAWGGCAYCQADDQPLQRDCVLPIARGGRYTRSNVVPACPSCNSSKCESEVGLWLRRKRLDEQAFLLRFTEITRSLIEVPPAEEVVRKPTSQRRALQSVGLVEEGARVADHRPRGRDRDQVG
jgi:hypothetical protein